MEQYSAVVSEGIIIKQVWRNTPVRRAKRTYLKQITFLTDKGRTHGSGLCLQCHIICFDAIHRNLEHLISLIGVAQAHHVTGHIILGFQPPPPCLSPQCCCPGRPLRRQYGFRPCPATHNPLLSCRWPDSISTKIPPQLGVPASGYPTLLS